MKARLLKLFFIIFDVFCKRSDFVSPLVELFFLLYEIVVVGEDIFVSVVAAVFHLISLLFVVPHDPVRAEPAVVKRHVVHSAPERGLLQHVA